MKCFSASPCLFTTIELKLRQDPRPAGWPLANGNDVSVLSDTKGTDSLLFPFSGSIVFVRDGFLG